MPSLLHDYLNIQDHDFRGVRLIVFSGESGSGKSTYIRYLLKTNPTFSDRNPVYVKQRPLNIAALRVKNALVVIDEISTYRHLLHVIRLLFGNNTLIVANHLPAVVLNLLGRLVHIKQFQLDNATDKITAYLQQHGYRYSEQTVRAFCRRYGANYTDLDIILEKATSCDFDQTYRRFHACYAIRLD